ncbi:MAG: ATP-dependent DNA helicase RecG [Mucilaginibacter polytrichastri]|nr:ATP-dependent DNA helicase RecG [Mucilaginibacter polytrichastri]
MNSDIFKTPIVYLQGVGPARGELLKKELGISTYDDLLHHFPFRYIDRTRFYKIREINDEMPYVQILARIRKKEIIGEKAKRRLVVSAFDDTGTIELVWFQGISWVEKQVVEGQVYILFGKPGFFNQQAQMAHPEIERYAKNASRNGNPKLQPVYSSTEKLGRNQLDSKGLQKLISALLDQTAQSIDESLPESILQRYKLMPKRQAFFTIHFPADSRQLAEAEKRLKFEELFVIQLRLLYAKTIKSLRFKGIVFDRIAEAFNTFYNEHLPFDLTGAQKRVLREIRVDTQKGTQMNRLVQGDVGSGKTVVALMSMLIAIDNGYQACMMAPTEILARQHYASLKSLLKGRLVNVEILTGSTPKKFRAGLHQQLLEGETDILVGTHALIEDAVQFRNLGLVVIDEQHRFGVQQRSKLWRKNTIPPHILVMTATPIPRTLAMTFYGDLDISVIDELPAGRKPIQTLHFFESQRLRLLGLIRQEIARGRQVYMVYPLIQESAKLDLMNLMDGFEALSREFPLPEYRLSIVHGQMPAKDKDAEMQRFIKGETHIMVATTVIEVGVNVPNASVMVIENAERFGLSQLHQLRGRVGRGSEQSFCFLMTGNKLSAEAKIRMETMVRTSDGFEIAETDLQLRGPGDIEGTRQSGVLDLKLASLATDQPLLLLARTTAEEILSADPELEKPESRLLKNLLRKNEGGIGWDKIS